MNYSSQPFASNVGQLWFYTHTHTHTHTEYADQISFGTLPLYTRKAGSENTCLKLLNWGPPTEWPAESKIRRGCPQTLSSAEEDGNRWHDLQLGTSAWRWHFPTWEPGLKPETGSAFLACQRSLCEDGHAGGEILMQTGEKMENADPNPRTSRSLTSVMNGWAAVLNNKGWSLGKQSQDKQEEGGMYQDLPGNHCYVTRVRTRNGLWRPQSYSLPPRQGLSSPLSSIQTLLGLQRTQRAYFSNEEDTPVYSVSLSKLLLSSAHHSWLSEKKKPRILDHGREAVIPESSFFFLELGSWVISSAQSFPNCYMCPIYSPLLAYTHTQTHEHTYMHMLLYILLHGYLHNENNTNILFALYTHIHISTWICAC